MELQSFGNIATATPAVAGERRMFCERCELLEAIREDRIKKFVALIEERKRHPQRREELMDKVNVIIIELNEAWKRLDEHRRSHHALIA